MKKITGLSPKPLVQPPATSQPADASRQVAKPQATAPQAPAGTPNEAAGPTARAALKALALDVPETQNQRANRGAAGATLGARIAQIVPAKAMRRASAAAAAGLAIFGSTPACLSGTVYAPGAERSARVVRTADGWKVQGGSPMSVRATLLSAKPDDAGVRTGASAPQSAALALSTAELRALRNPKLEAANVVAARDALEAIRREITDRSVRRGMSETPLPPAEMAALRRDVESLNHLPPVPASVTGKRQWIAINGPKVEKGRLAAHTLAMDAFFVDRTLQDEADAAKKQAEAANTLLTRTEEQAGLRAPKAPLDPNRPYGGLQEGLEKGSQYNPVVRVISPILKPVMVLGDIMDYATRPAQRQGYPERLREYEARVDEYQRAREQ